MTVLIIGTPDSGKSEKAEEIALSLSQGKKKYYIATMIPYGEAGTAALNAQALGSVYGPCAGPLFLAVSTALFALATILSWSFYGLRCWESLLGGRGVGLYRCFYILACLFGSAAGPEAVWALAEILNGLMCLPNLTALLILSPQVGALARSNEKKRGNPAALLL